MPFKEVNSTQELEQAIGEDPILKDLAEKESMNYEKVKLINKLIDELIKDGERLTATGEYFELENVSKIKLN